MTDTPTSDEVKAFQVDLTDKLTAGSKAAHESLDEAMKSEGYIRISGDNYDTPGKVEAYGWNDFDKDGKVD